MIMRMILLKYWGWVFWDDNESAAPSTIKMTAAATTTTITTK